MKYENVKNPIELLDYMSLNIKYGFVGSNGKVYDDPSSLKWKRDWYKFCIVQDGATLLKSGYGTCWDQVELERDWFFKHNYNFKTIFMYFDVDKSLPTHTFLMYEENGKYYWFEHAFFDNRGIHEFDSEQELIYYVIDKQYEAAVSYDGATIDDKKFIRCYEYIKPKPNIGVDEFYRHIISMGGYDETKCL